MTILKNRILKSIAIAVLIMLSGISTVFANTPSTYSTFTDVTPTHANFTAAEYLYELEIIQGYKEADATRTFKPDKTMTRAEIIKLVVLMKREKFGPEDDFHNCFVDVLKEWYEPYICYAKERGWVNGYADQSFKPNATATRLEAIKMMLNAFFGGPENILELTAKEKSTLMPMDSYDSTQWYYAFLHYALAKELLDDSHKTLMGGGVYKYYGDENVTRKEFVEFLYRLMISQDYEIVNFANGNFTDEYHVKQITTKSEAGSDGIVRLFVLLKLNTGDLTKDPYYAWLKTGEGMGQWDIVSPPTNELEDNEKLNAALLQSETPESLYQGVVSM